MSKSRSTQSPSSSPGFPSLRASSLARSTCGASAPRPLPRFVFFSKFFRIRTSEKLACNSIRIRTSKTQDLKPFRMNTCEKTGVGAPPLLSLPPYFFTSLPHPFVSLRHSDKLVCPAVVEEERLARRLKLSPVLKEPLFAGEHALDKHHVRHLPDFLPLFFRSEDRLIRSRNQLSWIGPIKH